MRNFINGMFLLLVLLNTGCIDVYERNLTVQNTSPKAISITCSYWPDPNTYSPVGHYPDHPILVPSVSSKIVYYSAYDKPQKDPNYYTLYAYRTSTLPEYTWAEIVEGNINDAVLFISVPELEKRNWAVTYPDDFQLNFTEETPCEEE